MGLLITIADSHLKQSAGTQPSVTALMLFRSKMRIAIFRSRQRPRAFLRSKKSIPERDKSLKASFLNTLVFVVLPFRLLEKSASKTQIKLSGSVSYDIIHVLTENICLWGNFVAPPPNPRQMTQKTNVVPSTFTPPVK